MYICTQALTQLNLTRRDAEWAERSVQLMVSIFLNPENETNWDEVTLEDVRSSPPSESVAAAEKLLRELPRSPRQQVLACYTLMAYRSRAHLEEAVAALLTLLNERVPLIYRYR